MPPPPPSRVPVGARVPPREPAAVPFPARWGREGDENVPQEREVTLPFLAGILDALPNPVFVKDERHRWVLAQRAVLPAHGPRAGRALGHSDHEFFPRAEADEFWRKDDAGLRHRRVVRTRSTSPTAPARSTSSSPARPSSSTRWAVASWSGSSPTSPSASRWRRSWSARATSWRAASPSAPRPSPAPTRSCARRTSTRTSSWPCSPTSCATRWRRIRNALWLLERPDATAGQAARPARPSTASSCT